MKKNKILSLSITLAMCAGLFCGCGKTADSGNSAPAADAEKKLNIVCTTFPQYDWMRQILGEELDDTELTMLIANGADLHNYQPTAEDIAKVGSADLFVYVGGESDVWVEDALKEATNPNLKSVNMLDVLGTDVKEEEIVEGMMSEEEEEEEGEEEGPEYDEHVWLSLKNAHALVQALSDELQTIDADHASVYEKNTTDYLARIDDLDEKYEKMVKDASLHTVVFGDRFPFRYLVDDYGLNYYAAFVGCSAETEASFKTITFLAKKVDEEQLPAILTIEKSDQKIAKTIQENTKKKDQNILAMHSLQSVTEQDLTDGFTYEKAMQDNLAVLQQALN